MIGFGQLTYVPDDIFEAHLEANGLGNGIPKVTDLLGRETKQTNQPLLYIYDDGTVEKKIILE